MKPTTPQISLTVVLLVIVFCLQGCNKKQSEKKLQLPSDMEKLTWNDSISFESDPLKKNVRSVAYLKPNAISQALRPYIYYIKNYPEVGFIFIISSNDDNKTCIGPDERKVIKKELEKIKFPSQVFIDPDNKYHRGYGFIAFLVNHNDIMEEVVNPSMPQYEDMLKEIIQKSRN
jgi:hypothetical protein